ncbi:MAG: ABC transporter permease [Deltaproteobacteria bacterium]|nr:ABC transporter permease [Deltaproteobacteria bacterium]
MSRRRPRWRPLAGLPQMMRKEMLQLRQDRKMLPLTFVAPVLQLLVFGYAAVLDVTEARVAMVDRDRSPASRQLAARLEAADNMTVTASVEDEREALRRIERGDNDLIVTVPRGYGRALVAGRSATVHATIDGSDAVAAGLGAAYAAAVVAQTASELAMARLASAGVSVPTVNVRPKVLYNPALIMRNFMVPAILALILVIFTSVLTAVALVREKEVGTLEQLIVTPISATALLLGKLLPFVLIGLIQSTLVVVVATWWFEVPLRGSLLLLYALMSLFILNTLAIGLFVSTISRTQQQAMLTTIFFFLLPMMFLSGFVFPIENMPPFFQKVSYIIPLRYFLTIVRGVFLKGVGIRELWFEATMLAAIGMLLFGGAVLRFRKRLD